MQTKIIFFSLLVLFLIVGFFIFWRPESFKTETEENNLKNNLKNIQQPYANMAIAYRDTNKCQNLGLAQCLMSANCGYMITDSTTGDNISRCVSGDIYGPYDKDLKYKLWLTNDDYSKAIMTANKGDFETSII